MSTPTRADIEVASSIAVFNGLKPAMIERLIAPATIMTLQDGQALFRQGEPASAFFIMVDGWVKLYRITLAGDEAVINVFTRGASFAEAVAFTEGVYPASAEAVSDSRIVRIPSDHVVRCIREMPDIALAMIASTSQHLHRLVVQVEQLKAQSGVQRVAEFLASLCPGDGSGCSISLPYDKALIAGRLGLKPESLSRAFAKLKSVGVDVCASQVVVQDVARLRSLATDDRARMRSELRRAR